jgi:hypothetical protein
VPAPSATSETPDVTSVVSLNGFLPSEKARGARFCSLMAGCFGTRLAEATREFVQHSSSTVSLPVLR